MAKVRLFISFDFDHDEDLRNMFVGQAKNPDTPFQLSDWSLRETLSGDWKEKVRARIRQVDQICVICGEHTDTASGVSVELTIAKEEIKPYFLLRGRKDKNCVRPKAATQSDKIYDWTWENVAKLLQGAR